MKLLPTLVTTRNPFESRTKQQILNQCRFHKNLFFDNISLEEFNDSNVFASNQSDDDDDGYTNDELTNDTANMSQYRLRNVSMPLADTFAEFVHELSNDRLFDLSFIFEISRKRVVSPYAIIVALIYLKRLQPQYKDKRWAPVPPVSSLYTSTPIPSVNNQSASSKNILSNTELCLISILLASKYLIDEGEDGEIYNEDWAYAADFTVTEVNQMEKEMLKQIDWNLYVSNEEFWDFTSKLTEKITRKKIQYQYGYCTYTDLNYLISCTNEFALNSLKKHLILLCKIMLVCTSTLVYAILSTSIITRVSILSNTLITNFNSNQPQMAAMDVNDTSCNSQIVSTPLDLNRIANYEVEYKNDMQEAVDEEVEEERNENLFCNYKSAVDNNTALWNEALHHRTQLLRRDYSNYQKNIYHIKYSYNLLTYFFNQK